MPIEQREGQENNYEQERAKYTVAFFGAGSEKTPLEKTAAELAEKLAESVVKEGGHPIVTGGYNMGVMEAASRGAGVAAQELGRDDLKPKGFAVGEVLGKKTEYAEVVDKESLSERLASLIKENQASIVLSGGSGTTNELVGALFDKAVNELLVAKGKVKLPEKPIVIVDPSGKHVDLIRFLSKQDPKVAGYLKHVYHVGIYDEKVDEAVKEAARIIEDYFQKSVENAVSPDEQTWLDNHSVKELLRKGEEFEQGEGI